MCRRRVSLHPLSLHFTLIQKNMQITLEKRKSQSNSKIGVCCCVDVMTLSVSCLVPVLFSGD